MSDDASTTHRTTGRSSAAPESSTRTLPRVTPSPAASAYVYTPSPEPGLSDATGGGGSQASEERRQRAAKQRKAAERLAQPSPTRPEKPFSWQHPVQKMAHEDEEKLVDRLYIQSVKQLRVRREMREKKYYQYEEPKRMPEEKIQENVVKLTEFETQRRQTALERLVHKYYAEEQPKKRAPEDVQESVQRLHDASIKNHADRQAKLEAKYAFHPAPLHHHHNTAGTGNGTDKQAGASGGKRSKLEWEVTVARLAQAKKLDYTTDPLYTATHGM